MLDINIDEFVDYRAEYSSRLSKAKVTGSELIACCPFHNDSSPSFSVNLPTGRWNCHAGCGHGNYITFRAMLDGTSTDDAYKNILREYGRYEEPTEVGQPKPKPKLSLTLEQYAKNKNLPADWLAQECGIQTVKSRGETEDAYIKIPYMDADRTEIGIRFRHAGPKGFRWGRGCKVADVGLYGMWRIQGIREQGYAILVEGESDSQTLWHLGFQALGVPGSQCFTPTEVAALDGLTLYIHEEPDAGGQAFTAKTLDILHRNLFSGTVKKFSCGVFNPVGVDPKRDKNGVKDPSALYLRDGADEAIRQLRLALDKAETVDLNALSTVLIDGAPIALNQPDDFIFSWDGVVRLPPPSKPKDAPKLICRTPILITKRLRNIDDPDSEQVELAFHRDGHWRTTVMQRDAAFSSRGIQSLANSGATVTSENARDVVAYLGALESANLDNIPIVESASYFGWKPDGRFIPSRNHGLYIDADPERKRIINAYRQSGDYQTWIDEMQSRRESDVFRFILAASFAAPLLEITEQRSFTVYNWGDSGGGKTAAIKAATSVWGDPSILLLTFNSTATYLERMAALFRDLPMAVDERQLAGKNQQAVENLIYMLTSGMGKGRATKTGGVQATRTWRTVALMTGEEPLAKSNTQTGVDNRAISIYGSPFESPESARRMHSSLETHFGYAGDTFIDRLIRTNREDVRASYEQMRGYTARHGEETGTSGSLVSGIALVGLADAIADQWIFQDDPAHTDPPDGKDLPLEIGRTSWLRAEQMVDSILRAQAEESQGDVSQSATDFVVDWIITNSENFRQSVHGPRYGYMSEDGNTAYIIPNALRKALEDAGYDYRKTLRYMDENELIRTTTEGGKRRTTINKRIGGRFARYIWFYIGKLAKSEPDALGDEDEDSEDAQMEIGADAESEDDELPF